MIKSKKFTGIYYNELKNGDRTYYITYKDSNKKMQRVKIGAHSAGIREAYCKQKRDEILNKQRLGEEPPAVTSRKKNQDLKYSEVWKHYIENKGMTDRSRKDFDARYKQYIDPILGDKPAATLSKEDLIKFRDSLDNISMKPKIGTKPKILSEKTKDMFIAIIGSAYNYWNSMAADEKEILINPVPLLRADDKQHVDKKKLKKRDIKRERFLNREEIKVLKEAVKDDAMLKMFIAVSLSTGARLSTVSMIQKTHVDLESRIITLINTKDADETYMGFISDELYELLKEVLPKMKAYEHIVSRDGSMITNRTVQGQLQKILNRLFNHGLSSQDSANRVVIHTLRHTFASHLAIAGTPIYTIQKLLDHKDISTTLRYAKLAPESGSDAVRGLKL
ncbi:MAG: site-specific integrase [Campylobacterota bacterium]|nr:site-specific integrase [Campylobacterota bacterium]